MLVNFVPGNRRLEIFFAGTGDVYDYLCGKWDVDGFLCGQ